MALNAPAPPLQDKLVDDRGYLTRPWQEYFGFQTQQQTLSAKVVGSALLATNLAASIGSTSLPIQIVHSGLYRISYYARITRAAGTSSSLTVTIGWSDESVTMTTSGAAMTGNTVTTAQTASLLIYVTQPGPITYSTTYASVGVPSMQYRLSVTSEFMG